MGDNMSLFKEKEAIEHNDITAQVREREANTPELDTYIPWLDGETEAKPVKPPISRDVSVIIDADSILYMAAHVGDNNYVPQEPKQSGALFQDKVTSLLDEQTNTFDAIINRISNDVTEKLSWKGLGVKEIVLLFTPRDMVRLEQKLQPNFRYRIVREYNEFMTAVYEHMEGFTYTPLKGYKANRVNMPSPPNVAEIMQHAIKTYKHILADGCEADDVAYRLKVDNPNDVVLCAIDKDILHGTPTGGIDHYNFRKDEWVSTEESDAWLFVYRQALMGDASDGIPGIYRCGVKTAEKILPTWLGHEESWKVVLDEYIQRGYTEEYAVLMFRLVYLGQFTSGGDIQLWSPQFSKKD
jgi:hypothetical protein